MLPANLTLGTWIAQYSSDSERRRKMLREYMNQQQDAHIIRPELMVALAEFEISEGTAFLLDP